MVPSFVHRRIRTIQLGDRDEQFVIDLLAFTQPHEIQLYDAQAIHPVLRNTAGQVHSCLQPVVDVLRPVLESKSWLKVGHNLRFDYEVLKWCLGLKMWNLYDTMLAEMVIHAGRYSFKQRGIWALDDCVLRYCNMVISKEEQTTFDLTSDLTTNQVVYCALDCRVPFPIKNGQRDLLTKGNLFYAAQIEFDAIPAFADMHLNGLLIDEDLFNKLLSQVREDHQKNIEMMDKFFIPIVGEKGIPPHNLDALEAAWRTEIDKPTRAELRKQFMAARTEIKAATKHLDDYEGLAAINYSAPMQVLKALRQAGYTASVLKDTNDRSLKKIAENPKWDVGKVKKENLYEKVERIDSIRLYRETKKLLDTYGEFLSIHRDPLTGRVHSEIKQLGAETGRTSSNKPNVQNIPRGSDWRSCFVARPGYKIITLDYNGCELRILAEYSREPIFLNAFLKNWDVHSVGAEIVFGDEWKQAAVTEPYLSEKGELIPRCAYYYKEKVAVNKQGVLIDLDNDHQKCSCPKHKALRDQVKAINFGIAYGMEAKKLAEELGIKVEEAKKLLLKYRGSFPTLIKYLEGSGNNAVMRMEARTLSQRRRLFTKPTWAEATRIAQLKLEDRGLPGPPSIAQVQSAYKQAYEAIKREGKNTPIQGSNADMAKIAMGCGFDKNGLQFMWHFLESKYDARLINFVHDEFVVEVQENTCEQECFNWVADCMTRGGAELVKLIPMLTDGHIDTKWKK